MFAQQSHARSLRVCHFTLCIDRHHSRIARGSTSLWVIVNLAKSSSFIFLKTGRNNLYSMALAASGQVAHLSIFPFRHDNIL